MNNDDFKKITEAFNRLADAIVELCRKITEAFIKVVRKLWSNVLSNVNPKSYYYYTHSKKHRVRKKHYNRIIKELRL